MPTENITFELLSEKGTFIESAQDGTCKMYDYQGVSYVVLSDNTVITQEEDNSETDEAIFPY